MTERVQDRARGAAVAELAVRAGKVQVAEAESESRAEDEREREKPMAEIHGSRSCEREPDPEGGVEAESDTVVPGEESIKDGPEVEKNKDGLGVVPNQGEAVGENALGVIVEASEVRGADPVSALEELSGTEWRPSVPNGQVQAPFRGAGARTRACGRGDPAPPRP